ncbi:hypothetical protein PHJA_001851900 [Phtheirospermum japonicum]|uniref:N-acetyltransferase domain-containing protein n=1 Tax=Phtheirospermum japonicum TaxID=374723 RepID=A0A830CIP3_9LAMI|nr:hypothetical protein PHJA_001851900 [Phtheirospermum japonicum]
MELRGNFLPQFEVRDTQLALLPSTTKRDHRPVIGIFSRPANPSRETFPSQYYRWKNLEVHCNNDQSVRHLDLSKNEGSKLPELSFDRLQLTDQECTGLQRRNFGRFVAREAILDEEFWVGFALSLSLSTAAWLRAEAHWESLSYMRHADSYKRKYAEEEFYALKRRCFGQEGNSLNCFCFVAVKKEDKNVRRTVLNSIVGTLDLSIRQFMQGEKHPGEIKRLSAVFASQEPFGTHKYAYIANVCVAKYARRQGIASNMLYLATDVAMTAGMKQLFVHVNADNKPAQDLYNKTGFKVNRLT